MACKHWSERPWYKMFVQPPTGNPVPYFDGRLPDRHERYDRIDDWLASDEANGLYICDTTWPGILKPGDSCHFDDVGHTFYFTDPDTAFAFKMKFL